VVGSVVASVIEMVMVPCFERIGMFVVHSFVVVVGEVKLVSTVEEATFESIVGEVNLVLVDYTVVVAVVVDAVAVVVDAAVVVGNFEIVDFLEANFEVVVGDIAVFVILEDKE
jgi:hypothetical protein